MHSIYSLDKTNQAALLEGVALLSRFYWGPTAEGSRDVLQGIYLRPFEALKLIVDYKPPGILNELKAINTFFRTRMRFFNAWSKPMSGCLSIVATALPPRCMLLVTRLGVGREEMHRSWDPPPS